MELVVSIVFVEIWHLAVVMCNWMELYRAVSISFCERNLYLWCSLYEDILTLSFGEWLLGHMLKVLVLAASRFYWSVCFMVYHVLIAGRKKDSIYCDKSFETFLQLHTNVHILIFQDDDGQGCEEIQHVHCQQTSGRRPQILGCHQQIHRRCW